MTNFALDALNRITQVTDPFGKVVSYGYDAVGNRTSLAYPDGKTVAYAYDPANRLTQVTDWNSNQTAYAYDAANRLTSMALPNGVNSSYSYDNANRLTGLSHTAPGSTLSSFQYSYDAVGNRTQAVENLESPAFVVTKTADTNDGACDADCSLREAIVAANAAAGPDTIFIPAGTYTLTRTGSDEVASVGDLDLTGQVTLIGKPMLGGESRPGWLGPARHLDGTAPEPPDHLQFLRREIHRGRESPSHLSLREACLVGEFAHGGPRR
ncbi:MAG: CSLREA domain-containing protein [Chloroflexota bacterium]